MKKALYIAFIFGILLLFSAQFGYAASARRAVKQGNRLYEEEKFEEALKEYQKAQGKLPDSDIVNFDVGTALYKKSDYRKAVDSFTKTLITEDKDLEAGANYNIGNAKYRQGSLIENSDLEDAIRLYRESLDYYKRAIELNEEDEDAKFNYEFVEKKLEALLKKQEQQENQKEKQEDKKDEQKEKDEQKKKKEQKKEEEKKKKKEEQKKQEEQKKEEE
ncbi:MAG: tetratricopeptide repeat protein, partial [Candidatus Omnitrophica bacterium]|nr:tetratricopeptide repeat protein [Candidatus Omnitrophota bacterium]